jgi:hypothetical protein
LRILSKTDSANATLNLKDNSIRIIGVTFAWQLHHCHAPKPRHWCCRFSQGRI